MRITVDDLARARRLRQLEENPIDFETHLADREAEMATITAHISATLRQLRATRHERARLIVEDACR